MYNKGHKVIVYKQLFKIKETISENLYKGCNENGCVAIFIPDNITETFIGIADPEFYYNAKLIKDNALNLKNNISDVGLCSENFCDELDNIIKLSEQVMNKFKYI